MTTGSFDHTVPTRHGCPELTPTMVFSPRWQPGRDTAHPTCKTTTARTATPLDTTVVPGYHLVQNGDQACQQACSACQQANTFIPDYHHRENTKPIGCWRKTREIQRTRRPCPGKLLHRGAPRTARAPHDEGVLCILTQFSNNQSPSLFR